MGNEVHRLAAIKVKMDYLRAVFTTETKRRDNRGHNNPRSKHHETALTVLTFLAFLTRFVGLEYPSFVVFDEAHTLRASPSSFPSTQSVRLSILTFLHSSHHGIFSEATFLTYTHHLGDCPMSSSSGSVDTMDISPQLPSASPTSPRECRILNFALYPPYSAC